MFKKVYLLIVGFAILSTAALAQSGTLKGKITDKNTGETIPFANVVAEKGGNLMAGVTTDFDGNYTIKPLDPGTYDLKVSFVGYGQLTLEGIVVSSNKITFRDIQLSEGIDIEEVVVKDEKPLLDPDNLGGKTVTAEEIKAMPTRSVASVAATAAGVYQSDEGASINVRGSRSNATDYYVDGMKVRGSLALPQSAIEQITVMQSGLPAMYGDATGGIISVTSKGPSNRLFGGVEVVSSQLFDDYNYNLLGFSLSGPIYKEIKEDGSKGRAILGYFLAGEARNIDDNSPSANGVWKVKQEKLEWLKDNLFTTVPNAQTSSVGLLSNATFLRAKDFENVQAKLNTNQSGVRLSGKLDFKPTLKTNLTIGGAVDHSVNHPFVYTYSLFNWDNNSEEESNTWRAYARFTQRFGSQEGDDEESASTIKNAFYTIQADYTKNDWERRNPNHGSDLFRYGHVGSFTSSKDKFFYFGDDTLTGRKDAWIHGGYMDTLYAFNAENTSNQMLADYTQQYYDMFEANEMTSLVSGYGADGVIRSPFDLGELGLTNGNNPRHVYSLWYNVGDQYGSYGKQQNEQFTLKATGSADIKDHAIQFGFEYEKRTDRYWGTSPMSLWGLARQHTNSHIMELDLANPHIIQNGTYDTIWYDRFNNESAQSTFDKSIRDNSGAEATEWIDLDSFDPSQLSIDMFSADEILNNGNSLVYYYGYDYAGNILNSNPTIKDFFEKKDNNGDFLRNIGAYEPIYTAGYIQDKFAFDDLIFNIGLRVDRFDANQSVLADQFALYPTYKAGDAPLLGGDTPLGIGEGYVVYVNDIENPTEVVGYRNGEVWYDVNGEEIANPKELAQATTTGQITPYLKNPGDSIPEFADYNPQTAFSPRISFSFPISDEAQFFAHYDVVTQRPPGGNRIEPVDYLFIEDKVGAVLNNPNLQPEKTVDFELGFAQTLNLNSSLTLSAFYREMRDMIQIVKANYAYPVSYLTYGNIDFSTVKGMSATYDLRRTGNVTMSANYTMQFADGTGSSTTSGYSLVNSGQPNLRTTIPLSHDQRHAINVSMDYRYASGKDYTGPVWFNKQVFSNAGANFVFVAGSGTPYTKQANITQDAAFGINNRSTLEGSLNGSRLPWQVRINTKMNKRFELEVGELDNKRTLGFNVYLQVQNLLNTKNVMSVYRATGNPDDDGYLNDASAQSEIAGQNDPQSFIDLYTMKVNNPSNYSLPRMARLGIEINF